MIRSIYLDPLRYVVTDTEEVKRLEPWVGVKCDIQREPGSLLETNR